MVAKKISCLLFRTNKEPLEKSAKENAKESKNVIFLDELHLNLWNFDKKFTYLDLGLLINVGPLEGLDKKELFISIPGKYESEGFFDLGKDLSSDSDMITAIFNEPIADTNDLDKKLVTSNDRRKFQAAVDDLRKSENKGQTRTITLSNNEQITIAVG